MELLLSAGVAVGAVVAVVAVGGVPPLVALLHIGAGRRAVLVALGRPPLVSAVVVLGAGVALPAQSRGPLARLRLVVGQHVLGVCKGRGR